MSSIALDLCKDAQSGNSLNLQKGGQGFPDAYIGLGWGITPNPAVPVNPHTGEPFPYDVDLTVLCTADDDKFTGVDNLLFFNSPQPIKAVPKQLYNGAVIMGEDAVEGSAEGSTEDEEYSILNFAGIPTYITRVHTIINLHGGNKRNNETGAIDHIKARDLNQQLSHVKNAFVRICDGNFEGAPEYKRWNFSGESAGDAVAFHVGYFARNTEGGWSFQPVGKPLVGEDLNEVIDNNFSG